MCASQKYLQYAHLNRTSVRRSVGTGTGTGTGSGDDDADTGTGINAD